VTAEPPLLVEQDGAVVLLTFNRPAQLNALSSDLRRRFIAVLAELARRDDVRVVILTGKGRAFTAGLDLKEIAGSDRSVEEHVGDENLVDAILAFPKPLIGAINGLAITGGFEIALALDIILVGNSASFADSHVRVGIVPGWGLSQRLARAVGLSRANELSLSGRPLGAREAVAWGLANDVYADDDLMPAAWALARRIADNDPLHVQRMKRLIATGWHETLGVGLALEDDEARRSNRAIDPVDVGKGFSRARTPSPARTAVKRNDE
jgi:enoyl-CoA hydratase